MSRIKQFFDQLKNKNGKALIPYFMAGYPTLEATQGLLRVAEQVGANIVELGIPYSDPLADGPSIQRAGWQALEQGVNTDTVFELVKQVRESVSIPIVIMTYYNTIYRYGLERFAGNAADSGVDGVICPDLPPEEVGPWKEAASQVALDTILLVAPTSSDERIQLVAKESSGFVYCVSLTGVTGARQEIPEELADFLQKVRRFTDKPLAVGFGISSPDLARAVARIADGVIIGSALINLIESNPQDYADKVTAYLRQVKQAISN